MGYTVFSGADYSVLIGLSTGGPLVALDTVESVSWSERRTKHPDQDSISGTLVQARYEDHPLFSRLEKIIQAQTIGQLPKLDLHLQALSEGKEGVVTGTCCVIRGITINRIQEGVSAQDITGAIAVHFTAEGVSHWHKI